MAATGGLRATVPAKSLHYKLLGGLAVWRACYGVLGSSWRVGSKAVRSHCLGISVNRRLNP